MDQIPFKSKILAVIFFACSSIAFAASVSVTELGTGTYAISGTNMDGVAGIDLTLTYDAKILQSPTVTKGSCLSNAIMAANTMMPGSVRIGAITTSPLPSSCSQIATVTFASQSGDAPLSVANFSPIDSYGTPVVNTATQTSSPPNATIVAPPSFTGTVASISNSSGGNTAYYGSAVTTPAPNSQQIVTLGRVDMSADLQTLTSSPLKSIDTTPISVMDTTGSNNGASADPAAAPVVQTVTQPAESANPANQEQTSPAPAGPASAAVQAVPTKAPEQEESADKNKKPNAAASGTVSLRQESPVVLSDGKVSVTVVADLSNGGEEEGPPNIALDNASLKSVEKVKDKSIWRITVILAANATNASVMILTAKGRLVTFPLAIAPPVKDPA